MEITLKSLGAAGTVTDSKYLLTTPNLRILVDCPHSRDVYDRANPLVPNSDNPFGRR